MRFRFTIRNLLWLIVVVALALGWWLDHRKLTAPRYAFSTLKSSSETVLTDTDTGDSWVRRGSEWIPAY